MSKQKILIAAGGTGGHIFPAQGFAQKISSSTTEVLFAAGGLSTNRYFDRSAFPYREVACSPLLKSHPLKFAKGIYNLIKGTHQAVKLMREYQPDAVVAFGSFYTIPILLAALLQKVPFILHEANSIPGKANKWLAPYAKAVGIHFPMTAPLLRGEVTHVGMPLRAGYRCGEVSRKEALAYFGLEGDLKTLLIFGGSQGAQGINQLISQCRLSNLQVIHLTGEQDHVEQFTNHYRALQVPAIVKPFEKNMQMAWSAADLFIGRAGAATIAEALEFEVPGLLIPYPHATDNHQEINGSFLVDVVKSALMFRESSLTTDQLMKSIDEIQRNLTSMKTCARDYKNRPRQIDLCGLVQTILAEKK